MRQDPISHVVHYRNYARFIPSKKRRENWNETVDRFMSYLNNKFMYGAVRKVIDWDLIETKVRNMEVMPSMRLMYSAGPAVENENQMAYNCKYQEMDSLKAFADLLYSLMCGCGVGISVEHGVVSRLPEIPGDIYIDKNSEPIVVEDSRAGWAVALYQYLNIGFHTGRLLRIDVSKVRPAGTELKTSGGFASGPEPLVALFGHLDSILVKANGRKLRPIEVYDISCRIADCVVTGGVRRSAMIALFSPSDREMMEAKTPKELTNKPWRYNSNNTVVLDSYGVDYNQLADIFSYVYANGEPGIFFRNNAMFQAGALGREIYPFGVNPCGEILLRPNQFCNLTEVVLRPENTLEQDMESVRAAVQLGILQSCLTDFGFIDGAAKENQEEERLLGVSLTGIMDVPEYTRDREGCFGALASLRGEASIEAERISKLLDINIPAAITCVKPSGTVSQLVGCSSGLHARYAKHYLRRIVVADTDPLNEFLVKSKVPFITVDGIYGKIFEFPVAAPGGSVVRSDLSAIDQLEINRIVTENWCEHNASCTIYFKKNEVKDIINYILEHRHSIRCLSFLPDSDTSTYPYLPFEEISADKYATLMKTFPKNIKWERLGGNFEDGSRELACSGDKCSLF